MIQEGEIDADTCFNVRGPAKMWEGDHLTLIFFKGIFYNDSKGEKKKSVQWGRRVECMGGRDVGRL